MRAFVKEDKWVQFIATAIGRGFFPDKTPGGNSIYVRNPLPEDPKNHVLLIITDDRELHLVTPFGETPFMEAHKDAYGDLLNDDFIVFERGEFD